MTQKQTRAKPKTWRQIRRTALSRWGKGHLAIAAGAGLVVATIGGRPALPSHAARSSEPPPPVQRDPAAANPMLTPSRTVEGQFASAGVGKTLPYLVYLPPGYDADPLRTYPVLYMLHGLGGSYHQWQELGLLETADQMMRAGEIPPFIIVLPQGDDAYWIDHANGGPRWGRFVAQELVGEIDRRYRTQPMRETRAIGGLSMGGHGALQLAINNPDVFGVVGAHSFVLRRFGQAFAYFGDQMYFNAHDPVYLYRQRQTAARSLRFWLDMGTGDGWHDPAASFHRQLSEEGIAHQWHEYPGGHDAAYWSAHTREYLSYYGGAFAGFAAGPPNEALGLAW